MSLYGAVRGLPLEIEGYELEPLELQARSDFLRKTTVVHLRGAGEEGIGEDVTYDGAEHDRLRHAVPIFRSGERGRCIHSRRTSRTSRSSSSSRRSTSTSTTAAGRSRAQRSTSPSGRQAAHSARRSGERHGR
jgi:hypothetical protein